MSSLNQQRNVSTQFDGVKTNFLGLRLGPFRQGLVKVNLHVLKPVNPWKGLSKCSSMSPARDFVFDNRKQIQTTWSSFEHILSYSLPIECHVKHYLAKQSFELTEFSRCLQHLSWTAVTNYFPSAGLKI